MVIDRHWNLTLGWVLILGMSVNIIRQLKWVTLTRSGSRQRIKPFPKNTSSLLVPSALRDNETQSIVDHLVLNTAH